MAVARVPGPLREFAHCRKAKGKPSKVAQLAVARKALVIASAVVRDGGWRDPKLAATARLRAYSLVRPPADHLGSLSRNGRTAFHVSSGCSSHG
jgi:hypothetical protein